MSTVVLAQPGTKALLTNEQSNPLGSICDLEGNHLGRDEYHKARELYVDSLTGTPIVKVSPSEASKLTAAGETVYQGIGEVGGWFIDAPDFTTKGILAAEEKTSVEIPQPPPSVGKNTHAPTPRKPAKKAVRK